MRTENDQPNRDEGADRNPCAICGVAEANGVYTPWKHLPHLNISVCSTCAMTGRIDVWMAPIHDCNIAMPIEPDDTLEAIRQHYMDYHKHSSRIEDGVCPNGCARLVQYGKHLGVVTCPVCEFIGNGFELADGATEL